MSSPPRIAVVGSANTDLVTFTDVFPRPGETVFGKNFDLGFGGKGGSLAAFLAEGMPEARALERASLYAALSTTRIGTQKSFPQRAEFDQEWDRRSASTLRSRRQ